MLLQPPLAQNQNQSQKPFIPSCPPKAACKHLQLAATALLMTTTDEQAIYNPIFSSPSLSIPDEISSPPSKLNTDEATHLPPNDDREHLISQDTDGGVVNEMIKGEDKYVEPCIELIPEPHHSFGD